MAGDTHAIHGLNLARPSAPPVLRSCSAFRHSQSDGTEKNPRPSLGWAGAKFWGKQIEMAVSPCRHGPRSGQFQSLGQKSTATQRA
jgi:hypothetical protein